jgi:hypothetical protein
VKRGKKTVVTVETLRMVVLRFDPDRGGGQ